MKDLKRQSNRRPVVRKFRSSPMTVRKNRSNPLPGLSVKLRKANSEPGFSNYWLPSYFVKNEPAFLRKKIRFLVNKFIGILGLICFLWFAGGSVWVGQAFFNYPIKKVFIKGENLLSEVEVLNTSGLRPGQHLSSLKLYRIAESLQKHPAIQKADIRVKFPDEIHLFIREYQPIALLKIPKSNPTIGQDYFSRIDYYLIGEEQRLIKKMSINQILNTNYDKLPLISGLGTKSLQIGIRLNSPVLERGLGFLEIFKNIATQSRQTEKVNLYENQYKLVNFNPNNIHIDVSDPLNLKIKWPGDNSKFEKGSKKLFQKLPLTIQMGSRNFDKRLITLQNIYPILYKQHPGLKSIDLRYKNRVMLIP